jgi:hypothetical protein
MSEPSTVVPAVHLGQDDGEPFRLGPLEIIVKENGSGTRMNLAVAEFRGANFRIPRIFTPSMMRRSTCWRGRWG